MCVCDFLPLLLLLSLSLCPSHTICLQITVAGVDRVVSGVKLAIVGVLGVGVGRRRPLRLVQRVAALVLFPHPVHDEHDDEDGAEQADHRAADHSCENARLREEAGGPVLILGVHDQHAAAAVRVVVVVVGAVVASATASAGAALAVRRRNVLRLADLEVPVRRVLYAGAAGRRFAVLAGAG